MFEFLVEIYSKVPSPLYLNYVLMGGFVLSFGLVSLFVKEHLYLTESIVATLVGVAMGPFGLKVVIPQVWFKDNFYSMMLEFSRLVIAMQVMAVGVSTPGGYLVKQWRSIAFFLGPIMLVMYLISAMAVKLVLGLGWCESFIIGACVTPTDPVLANCVIKGKFANRYVPYNLRNLLAVESGANDGLGFPLLMLPVWLLLSKTRTEALQHWMIHTWLYEITFSIVIGILCGSAARFLLRKSEEHKLIDKESFLVFSIALALLVTGLVAIISSDDLLAVFIAGNAFAWDEHFLEATHDSHIVEVIDMFFNISYFVFFGAIIPWSVWWHHFTLWRLALLSAVILLFRRLPIVMALRPILPVLNSRKEAFFAGWFGPMGVGAIFFSIMTRDAFINHGHPDAPIVELVFPVVSFLVLSSIIIHGITVPITNFHMKKRAKRKRHRKDKLQHALEAIADAAISPPASEPTSPLSLGGGGGGGGLVVSQDRRFEMRDEDDEYEYITDYEEEESDHEHSLMEEGLVTPSGMSEGAKPRKTRRRRPLDSTQATVTSTSDLHE